MNSPVLVLNSDSQPMSLFPISTLGWQPAIRAVFLDTVSVVAEYDNWAVHSPSMTMKVPSIIMTKRYLHFQKSVVFTDANIFLRDRYTCQYCHMVFDPSKLTMDHVVPRTYGGQTTWENISTACGPCNFRKGSNRKIVPKILPRKPTYYEMLKIRKEYPIIIPCESWIDYIGWDENNIRINNKMKVTN